MKDYPLTFNELIGLGGFGLIAGFLVSVGNFLLSTWWQINQEFAFSPPKDAAVAAYWHGLQHMAVIGAIALYIGAAGVILVGGSTVIRILIETKHK